MNIEGRFFLTPRGGVLKQMDTIMRNAEKLKKSMKPGRVYRWEELEEFSTSVGRDLKTLVESSDVKKLSRSLSGIKIL